MCVSPRSMSHVSPPLTFAALMSSSAKHSAMVLMLRKAASRAPVQRSQMAWTDGRMLGTARGGGGDGHSTPTHTPQGGG